MELPTKSSQGQGLVSRSLHSLTQNISAISEPSPANKEPRGSQEGDRAAEALGQGLSLAGNAPREEGRRGFAKPALD